VHSWNSRAACSSRSSAARYATKASERSDCAPVVNVVMATYGYRGRCLLPISRPDRLIRIGDVRCWPHDCRSFGPPGRLKLRGRRNERAALDALLAAAPASRSCSPRCADASRSCRPWSRTSQRRQGARGGLRALAFAGQARAVLFNGSVATRRPPPCARPSTSHPIPSWARRGRSPPRPLERRDRRPAVHQPTHRRVSPTQGLLQARHHLPQPNRRGPARHHQRRAAGVTSQLGTPP
jgi:hypothetical protein